MTAGKLDNHKINIMDQAMDENSTFETDEAKEAYINELIIETEELEVKAKFAKAFAEMYESANFKLVMLDGLLVEHAADRAKELVSPYTGKEVEEEILFELRALRYLNRYLETSKTKSLDADRLVRDNKQLILNIQLGKEDR